jgi:hypothetical protein
MSVVNVFFICSYLQILTGELPASAVALQGFSVKPVSATLAAPAGINPSLKSPVSSRNVA